MEHSKSIQALQKRLAMVRGLSFIASSEASFPTGWSGTGHARVDAEVCAGKVLIFHEEGEWQPTNAKAMKFSNTYRWTFLEERVQLEHLRFGPENPVYLFDLVNAGEDIWESAGPHVCREDCYKARLETTYPDLIFDWTITGPKKNERIRYVYR